MEVGHVLIVEPGKLGGDGPRGIVASHGDSVGGLELYDVVVGSHDVGSVGKGGGVEGGENLDPPSCGDLAAIHVVQLHVPICSVGVVLADLGWVDVKRGVSHCPAFSDVVDSACELYLDDAQLSGGNLGRSFIERDRQVEHVECTRGEGVG